MAKIDDEVQKDIKRLVKDITEHPDHWQAYVDLVNVLTVTNSLVEAEELALKSLSIFKDNADAQQELFYATGNVYYTAADYTRATSFFNKITDEKLKHDAIMMQAQSFYAQNKFKQALVFALTAVQQDDQDLSAQVLLGNIWLSLGDSKAAREAFDAALAINQVNYSANFGRGVVAEALNEQDNQWLQAAQNINPKQYQADAGRLDDLIKVMLGSTSDERNSN